MGSNTQVQFGKALKDQFLFDPEWRNLNNGSFGTIPRAVREAQIAFQNRAEAQPDKFIRYEYPVLLDESRAALAAHLNVPVDEVVFAANATTAVNIVLRNLTWSPDGLDEILSFSTIYGACGKTIEYIVDTHPGLVAHRAVPLTYPLEDDEVVSRFRAAVEASRAAGRRPRIAVYDCVTSQPGVRFPFEAITAACRELGVLSLVDGAQGVGMVKLDLAAVDADFFLSNCHKWLFAPRGCAFLHVPVRNQPLMRSTLPTSHGYVPLSTPGAVSPLPSVGGKSPWVRSFEFVGTVDNSSFICVKAALEYRRDVLGGEERILEYLWRLAKEGGARAAEILGTEVIDNKTKTLTNNAMVNVWLPVAADTVDAGALQWTQSVLVDEYKTFIALGSHNGRWFARLSAQVYLDMEDFEWAANALREVTARAVKERAVQKA
ncbi:lolT-1 [Plectosphaerella cucumerina]|uniref:LolT-1 n=1 Tax=Plectosphaerella cucumerina TaxID=40658 RepID=A0A8K0TGR8_9PEZI|nr:lolT-1 [Plectosphaerella cucumerina]